MLSIYLYTLNRRKSDAAPVHFCIGHDVIHELIFIINEKRRQTITIIKSFSLSILGGKANIIENN